MILSLISSVDCRLHQSFFRRCIRHTCSVMHLFDLALTTVVASMMMVVGAMVAHRVTITSSSVMMVVMSMIIIRRIATHPLTRVISIIVIISTIVPSFISGLPRVTRTRRPSTTSSRAAAPTATAARGWWTRAWAFDWLLRLLNMFLRLLALLRF